MSSEFKHNIMLATSQANSVSARSREELVYIIRERIASSEPRALLEACEEAEAKYT